MPQHGFKIVSMTDLPAQSKQFSWRVVHPFDFTIETHPNCPIDGTPLETIAGLVSLTLPEKIRVGCCPRCGLVGYIDRPSQSDIDRYYAETWMGETFADAHARALYLSLFEPSESDARLLVDLPVDRSLPVLEIGCGYGRTINALQRTGFTSIDATEHCPARAEAVRQVFGVNVTTEIPDKRYGLIVSHHVLEHLCDPAALIRECAKRQQQGDWMIHSLPNFVAEPSCGVLFFLPHLWSFSPHSLSAMAARDYRTIDRQVNGMGLCGTFQRHPGGEGRVIQPYVKLAINKFLHGLGLAPQRSVLSWQRDGDGTALKSLSYAQTAAASNFPRSIVVEPLERFVTDAPIEIQFPERVQMFLK